MTTTTGLWNPTSIGRIALGHRLDYTTTTTAGTRAD